MSNVATTMMSPRFLGKGTIAFAEKLVPAPGPGQLLLEVRANALCGSERHQFYDGTATTPGHEVAGSVVAVGPDTTTPVGTPGVVFLMDFCGTCRSCRQGFTNQCLDKRGDIGFNRDGGYGKYVLVPETIFFPIPMDISFTDATLLLDIMGTGGHAIKRAQSAHSDIQSILVAGAGPIGLAVLAMAKILLFQDPQTDRINEDVPNRPAPTLDTSSFSHSKPKRSSGYAPGEHIPVVITDVNPYRLALAEKLGARPINVKEEPLSAGLQRLGLTIDVAIDTSGKTMARQSCLDVLEQRGVLVCVGHGEALQLAVSRDLIATERAILGSEYFCFNELTANSALLHQHRDYLRQIITHTFPITRIQEAFELFFAGNTGKVVIEQ